MELVPASDQLILQFSMAAPASKEGRLAVYLEYISFDEARD